MIRNPNDIVEKLVAELRGVFGEHLRSVVLYGSAVSHEFKPGKSDVNIAVVFDEMPVSLLEKGTDVFRTWMRRGVAVPLLLTSEYINTLATDFPVEILDIQNSSRLLAGEDLFASVKIGRPELERQCRRELLGIALQLRREYVRFAEKPKILASVMERAVRALLPVFKAVALLGNRKIPAAKGELVGVVEDLFGLGSSILSQIMNSPASASTSPGDRLDQLLHIVELIADRIGAPADDPVPAVRTGEETTTSA